MLHPEETRRNSAGLGGRGKVNFSGATERATGEDQRRTREHLARAEALGPDIHAVVGTSLDKGVELDALVKMKPEDVAEAMTKQAIFSLVHKAWLEDMASWGGMKGDAETMRTQCERIESASKTHDWAKTQDSLGQK